MDFVASLPFGGKSEIFVKEIEPEIDEQEVMNDRPGDDFDQDDDGFNEDGEDAYEDADDDDADADDADAENQESNGQGTGDGDDQPSEATDNNVSTENPIALHIEEGDASSDAKEPAHEQMDGPRDALNYTQQQMEETPKMASDSYDDTKKQMEETQKMASDSCEDSKQPQKMASDSYIDSKQQMEETQKIASVEDKDTKQQMEETEKMASDTYKDTKQQMEETQKMASDTYKDTKQQMEETQKMASDTYKDMKQQMEETQKMAMDTYKDTKQQMEETQKMASDTYKDTKQQMEETQKMASDTYNRTKQQMEETQKMAMDTYKDTKQQVEKTQKMAMDTYKDTKQQVEKTQKMASDVYKGSNQAMGTFNKPSITSNKNNNPAAANNANATAPPPSQSQKQKPQGQPQRQRKEPQPEKPRRQQRQALQPQPPAQQKESVSPPQTPPQLQEKKVSDTPPNTKQVTQQQLEAPAKPIPRVEEKVPIPSGVVAPPRGNEANVAASMTQIPQESVSLRQVQPQQQPQQDSVSPSQAEAQPKVNHPSVAPETTRPQPRPLPETQTQPRSIPLVQENMLSPSDAVVPLAPTPEEDAANLYRAFKGIGCDVGQLVQILSKRDPTHRHKIAQHYMKNYHEELSDRISSELGTLGKGVLKEKVGLDLSIKATGCLGWLCKDIKRAISLWLLEESERDATIVWQSLQLTSQDKPALAEVICSRTLSQIRNLKRAYFNRYKSELSTDITSSNLLFSSNTRELLLACLNDKARDEDSNVDVKKAEEDARLLYKDGENMWGTNNITFIDIFTKRNRPHLAAVDAAYDRLYGHSLEEAVRSETSRTFQAGLLTLLKCAKNPAKYFAEVLYNSMKGLGTEKATLMRVVVTRAGIDMEDIKREYVQAYKTSLKDYIHNDTSGAFRTFLLNVVE